jgi:hypothetical protein
MVGDKQNQTNLRVLESKREHIWTVELGCNIAARVWTGWERPGRLDTVVLGVRTNAGFFEMTYFTSTHATCFYHVQSTKHKPK